MKSDIEQLVPDVETLALRLGSVDYLVDEGLATALFLSLRLPQPLLLEGEAGVGKTEAAKALAGALDTPLIRLQGLDASEALYEWNYPRQLLSIRLADSEGTKLREEDLFGPDYLIRRPLLLEGAAGVGKTEAAKALAAVLDTPLIRLQCYEGIDAAEALYEWNYTRQLLSIRLADAGGETLREEDLFGPDYLIRRPLRRICSVPTT